MNRRLLWVSFLGSSPRSGYAEQQVLHGRAGVRLLRVAQLGGELVRVLDQRARVVLQLLLDVGRERVEQLALRASLEVRRG